MSRVPVLAWAPGVVSQLTSRRHDDERERDMTRVLVTGVHGKTGLVLANLLVAHRGVEVLGGSSSPSTVSVEGVHPTAFSWDDPPGGQRRPAGSTRCTSSDRTVPMRRS
jgi:hypothetical protein